MYIWYRWFNVGSWDHHPIQMADECWTEHSWPAPAEEHWTSDFMDSVVDFEDNSVNRIRLSGYAARKISWPSFRDMLQSKEIKAIGGSSYLFINIVYSFTSLPFPPLFHIVMSLVAFPWKWVALPLRYFHRHPLYTGTCRFWQESNGSAVCASHLAAHITESTSSVSTGAF